MPLAWASFSIAAPDAESRLTIISTLMPLDSMLSAMVFILAASFCAFWAAQRQQWSGNFVRVNISVRPPASATSKPFRCPDGTCLPRPSACSTRSVRIGSEQRPYDVLHDAAVPVVLGLTGRVNADTRFE